MTKKQLALEVIRRLKEAYPDSDCTLEYDQAWKLLVSVRLAAQCTDARVNVVVEKLYEKFPDVDALAAAEVSEIEEIVRPCGLGKSKAKDVFGKPAIVTDTHCIRLANRIGLVKDLKDPKKVEMELWKIIPPEEGNSLCHRFVDHGREVCTARTTPHCDRCVLKDICATGKKV